MLGIFIGPTALAGMASAQPTRPADTNSMDRAGDQTNRLCAAAASMKEENSGCGSNGRDFNSGWN